MCKYSGIHMPRNCDLNINSCQTHTEESIVFEIELYICSVTHIKI